MSWHGGLESSDYFVIPAGSKHKRQAQALVRYAVGQTAQAAFPRSIDYGPTNRLALEALPEAIRARLPTAPSHADESVRFDGSWWLEHEDEAHRRYDEWMAQVR